MSRIYGATVVKKSVDVASEEGQVAEGFRVLKAYIGAVWLLMSFLFHRIYIKLNTDPEQYRNTAI